MTKISYEHKLDDALNFLATHGARGGSFDYYDKRRSEANGFKEYLFKHLADTYKIDENEMFPILYNLIGDGYVDAVWEPVTAKEAGQQPNQIKISYKGIAFDRKGGYKKQKFKDGLKKTVQFVNIGAVTLAALAAILHYSLEIKDRCDKKPDSCNNCMQTLNFTPVSPINNHSATICGTALHEKESQEIHKVLEQQKDSTSKQKSK